MVNVNNIIWREKTEKYKKYHFFGKIWRKKFISATLLNFWLRSDITTIRISKFMIVYELWHLFDCIGFFLWFFFAYFSENSKYFQKPLFFQTIQWHSMITAKYESIWPMENWSSSCLIWRSIWLRLCPTESLILLWIKSCYKFIEIHI